MISTKTANSFLMGLSQIGGYAFFGMLDGKYWMYGLALGVRAAFGIILDKRFLAGIKSITFRSFVIGFMVISGILLIPGLIRELL